MNETGITLSHRNFLKALDLEHLNDLEFRLFSVRKLEKESMEWVVRHLSECQKCVALASPPLTEKEISDALSSTKYGRVELIDQIKNYYFENLEGRNRI